MRRNKKKLNDIKIGEKIYLESARDFHDTTFEIIKDEILREIEVMPWYIMVKGIGLVLGLGFVTLSMLLWIE